jgi:hypothetical protein
MYNDKGFLATLYIVLGGAILFVSLKSWIINLVFVILGFWLLNRGMVMRGMPGLFFTFNRWFNERNRYY